MLDENVEGKEKKHLHNEMPLWMKVDQRNDSNFCRCWWWQWWSYLWIWKYFLFPYTTSIIGYIDRALFGCLGYLNVSLMVLRLCEVFRNSNKHTFIAATPFLLRKPHRVNRTDHLIKPLHTRVDTESSCRLSLEQVHYQIKTTKWWSYRKDGCHNYVEITTSPTQCTKLGLYIYIYIYIWRNSALRVHWTLKFKGQAYGHMTTPSFVWVNMLQLVGYENCINKILVLCES